MLMEMFQWVSKNVKSYKKKLQKDHFLLKNGNNSKKHEYNYHIQ